MKQELVEALKADLNDVLRFDLAEAVVNDDGLILVCQNDVEGFFTIQLDSKLKNLSYDPYMD